MPRPIDHAASFRALYACHRDDVWRYLRRRTDHDVAEDLTTEVFVVAWRRRPEPIGEALPWLYGVARHVLANHRRGAGRAVALAEKAGRHARAAEDDHADWVGVRTDVATALRQLPKDDCEVLLLVAWEGLTSAEAAEVLGCRAATARVRLHRARKRLRAALDPDDPAAATTAMELVR